MLKICPHPAPRLLLRILVLGGQAAIAWLAVCLTAAAHAAEPMGLNFNLASRFPPAESVESVAVAIDHSTDPPLPAAARHAPIGTQTNALPPPPTVPNWVAVAPVPKETSAAIASGNLEFELARSSPPIPPPAVPAAEPVRTLQPAPAQADLFAGDSDSLVAKAVGSAEGTRTPEGGYTSAYQGHVDPGNGAWNLGSFSYQHGATSPQAADRRQLDRLRTQAQTLRTQADRYEMKLTLAELLNGVDLANQSPRAALSRGGYIDRLHQAHEMNLQGADAILWARTRAFLDPDTARWNAPGLGNNVYSITADQDRRRKAIDRAIDRQQNSPQRQ